MGPPGKLGAKLEKVARKGTQKCDARKMLRLVEKSVLLIGQTNILLNYNMQLNVLARFLRDPKALHKRPKGHKHGGHKYRRGASPHSRSTYRSTRARGRKPFHQGPWTRPKELGAHA